MPNLDWASLCEKPKSEKRTWVTRFCGYSKHEKPGGGPGFVELI